MLVVATSATDKSRTAKLLEKRKDALVSMFYPPDLSTVAGAVRTMADAAGLRLGGDLAERIARGAGLDVRLAQSEVTKLALYCDADPQSPKSATPEDHAAIGAATEEDGFAPLVNAVLGGELGRISGEIRRIRELGAQSGRPGAGAGTARGANWRRSPPSLARAVRSTGSTKARRRGSASSSKRNAISASNMIAGACPPNAAPS